MIAANIFAATVAVAGATDTGPAMTALERAQQAVDQASSASGALHQAWSPDLMRFLATGVLGFSSVALIIISVLLWRAGATPRQVLRVFGVMVILAFSALLLVVGYSNEQLTPIVGLFGAIAGYLLGKDAWDDKDE